MRPTRSVHSLALILFSAITCALTACGGGSNSTGGSGSGSNPSSAEYLYAKGFVDVLAFKVDTSSGKISPIQTVKGTSTTFTDNIYGTALAAPSSADFLYVVAPEDQAINAYTINSDGTLSLASGSPFSMPSGFPASAYISSITVDPAGNALYAVDTGDNLIAAYKVNSQTGSLTAISNGFQTGALPVQAIVDSLGQNVYVTEDIDSFSDQNQYAGISAYAIDSSSASLSPLSNSPFTLPYNSQPIGIVSDPTGRFVYAAMSNSNAIAGFTRATANGGLSPMPGSPFVTEQVQFTTQTYYLVMHPSGKFLFALNLNGHNISAFAIDQNSGELTPVTGSPFPPQDLPDNSNHVPTTQGPMAIDPSGKLLYVLCTEPLIAAYKINLTTGALTVAGGSPFPVSENVDGLTLVSK